MPVTRADITAPAGRAEKLENGENGREGAGLSVARRLLTKPEQSIVVPSSA